MEETPVKEVLSTNDPLKLSFAQAVLKAAGVEVVTLDGGTSNVYGGALDMVQHRLMVSEGDAETAHEALKAAFAASAKPPGMG